MYETKETIKQATAFAYGYSLVMLQSTEKVEEDRLIRCQNLLDDMRYFGILAPDGKNAIEPYYRHQFEGASKAMRYLESRASS